MIKKFLWHLVAQLGRPIRDERTGRLLGRGLVARWAGRLWLIGLHRPYVRPVFLPQSRLRYARHQIGFATHEPVDYPRLLPPAEAPEARSVLWAILFHQPPEECALILDYWRQLGYPAESILVVHGGQEADFQKLAHPHKVFVPDPSLRTRRHPVEKQSYAGPLREIARWLSSQASFNYVCLLEYDHLPLVPDWDAHLTSLAAIEQADVLFHHLTRVDGTNAPHYLYHLAEPGFASAWKRSSLREDRQVVLNCMATGSFWKREAFTAVAATPEQQPVYLEMYLPTQAHHLGFRVRDLVGQNAFVHFDPLLPQEITAAHPAGAWALHPLKTTSERSLLTRPQG